MPKGYKTITIKEEVHKELKAFAEETYRSIPEAVEYLLAKFRKMEVKA